MISDIMVYEFFLDIRRSCYTQDGQETVIKKMCDEFTKRNKENIEAGETDNK